MQKKRHNDGKKHHESADIKNRNRAFCDGRKKNTKRAFALCLRTFSNFHGLGRVPFPDTADDHSDKQRRDDLYAPQQPACFSALPYPDADGSQDERRSRVVAESERPFGFGFCAVSVFVQRRNGFCSYRKPGNQSEQHRGGAGARNAKNFAGKRFRISSRSLRISAFDKNSRKNNKRKQRRDKNGQAYFDPLFRGIAGNLRKNENPDDTADGQHKNEDAPDPASGFYFHFIPLGYCFFGQNGVKYDR